MAQEHKPDWKDSLLTRLHDPKQLRIVVALGFLLIGYGAVYWPISGTLTETSAQLKKERKRLVLARDVEKLREVESRYVDRLPKNTDPNEWVEYLLGYVRTLPVKLVSLDSKTPIDIGPFKAVTLIVELEGSFQDMERMLHWIETNERLFRVDSVKIAPNRNRNGRLVMQLVVLGVMG